MMSLIASLAAGRLGALLSAGAVCAKAGPANATEAKSETSTRRSKLVITLPPETVLLWNGKTVMRRGSGQSPRTDNRANRADRDSFATKQSAHLIVMPGLS
ncbi:hypothetical protein NEE01_11755 [Sphingomonas sp. MMSM24]|uniref:Secreted protein n=1 Tax=Sphingomonas lycopersici TaxID=2951807 RepID=A0AA41Z7K0_9SPHN|nr:hypothetical protein [Sphingomonas lycopersici]MCW6535455.1 hypothetical protein [Sphingomonas lycopersici]